MSSYLLVGPRCSRKSSWTRLLKKHASGRQVIAVDGGLDFTLHAKIKPEIAIGDWDSLRNPSILKRVPHVSLKQSKDESDLGVALRWAQMRGAKDIVCIGFTGGRSDHFIAAQMELFRFKGKVQLISPEEEFHFLNAHRKALSLKLRQKQVFSVFAFGRSSTGVRISGAAYPLSEENLKPGSLGLSNLASGGRTRVSIQSGQLLWVIQR